MTPETAAALEASIAHWEANAVAETPLDASVNGYDCALCMAQRGCDGCPVMVATGHLSCLGSPFPTANRAFWQWRSFPSDPAAKEAFRAAARAEVEFLKGLRE